jgi:transposase
MAKRQQFTTEFKVEAVRLWKSSGRPAAAIARELGLRRNHLYKWQLELETHGEAAFPGKGGRAHSTDELTRLRRENARLREERDILKKAAVGSSGESNTCLQYSRWRLKSQRLSRPLIQTDRDPVQVCLGVL